MLENLKQIQSDPNYYIDVEGNVYDSDLKVLTPYIGGNGSYVVTLQKTLNRKNRTDNKKNVIIARLLLEHFVRRPTKKDVALFIDGNKLNHKLSNLKWGTSKDVHAVKFDDEIILNIKERLLKGTSQIDIAKEFGISYGHLSKIKHGITRTYLNT